MSDAEAAWAEWCNRWGPRRTGNNESHFKAGYAAGRLDGQAAQVVLASKYMAERDAARADLAAATARIAELEGYVHSVAAGALVEEAEQGVRRIHAEVERDVARQALTSADAMDRHWDEINAERDRLNAGNAALRERIAELEETWLQEVEDRDAMLIERDARIDKALALADEWRAAQVRCCGRGLTTMCEFHDPTQNFIDELRAALSEGDG
jgi:hypothetical protein